MKVGINMNNEKRLRVAGYGRVSTDSKDQKNSYEHQKNSYDRDYKNNPLYIYNEKYLYFDRGITGTKLTRPRFDRMLEDAGLDIIEVRNKDNDNRKRYLVYITVPSSSRKPCFDLIIVRNTSRFARNINAVQILEQLKQIKVYVYFCDIDKTTEKDTDMEEIESHILSAERESRIKSRMVRFGTNEGAKEGVIRASSRLYGYKFIKAEFPIDDRLEIIESEAEVIRKIYGWYLQGYGMRRIMKLLAENEIYTRKGKEFTQNTIRGILTNEKYKGWNVRNKYDTGVVFHKNTYPKVRDKSEWIIHKDTDKVPAIVSEEDFDKVQELLHSKKEYKLNVGKYNGISEFASRIVCGKCGGIYYANNDKGRRFYNCSTKKKFGVTRCNNGNINLDQINERISAENYRRDLYEANVSCSQVLTILAYKLMQNIDNKAGEKVKELQAQLDDMKARKNRLVDIYTRGDIEESDYSKRIQPINQEIKQLEEQITQFSKNNNEIMQDLAEISETTAELRHDFEIYTNQSLKDFEKEHIRDYIVADIEKITVQENGTMDIEYKTFNKYFKLVEKHRKLLNVFINGNDYNKLRQEIIDNVEIAKKEISNKLKNAST